MRNSHIKPSRLTGARRAFRPDRQVYRQLRRGTRKRANRLLWIGVILLIALAGVMLAVKWALA